MAERDPQFVEKAVAIIELELHPPTDGPTFLVDEKTGIGVHEPTAPSQPPAPNQPARREFEYVRHGTADLLAAFALVTGLVSGIVRRQHRSAEFIELLRLLDALVPKEQVIHLIADPVRLHRSAEVAVYVAYRPWRFQFHWLPVHGSWLSFIEAWFAILDKKCLARSDWTTFDDAARDILAFIATYDAYQAHPFTWRKGIQFYQRLKDKLAHQQQAEPPSEKAA
jgi:transposase